MINDRERRRIWAMLLECNRKLADLESKTGMKLNGERPLVEAPPAGAAGGEPVADARGAEGANATEMTAATGPACESSSTGGG